MRNLSRECNAYWRKQGYTYNPLSNADCGVRALAWCLSMSYELAMNRLKGHLYLGHVLRRSTHLGYKFTRYRIRYLTPVRFAKAHPTGRFILYQKWGKGKRCHHYSACIDGELVNSMGYTHVDCVFEATPENDNAHFA
jgi:hypothetical protein